MIDQAHGDEHGAPALPPEEPQEGVVTPGEDEVQQPDKHERPAQE
jgi:hypothetical protein